MACRSSHEERGLKSWVQFFECIFFSRSSHEERGLKYLAGTWLWIGGKSLLA